MREITSEYISMDKSVVLKIDPHSLVSVEKRGDDLIITDKNGQKYLVSKFFVGEENTVLFEFDGSQYIAHIEETSNGIELVFNKVTDEVSDFVEPNESNESGLTGGEWFSIIVGTAFLGGGIGLASSGSGSGPGRKSDNEKPAVDDKRQQKLLTEKALIEKSGQVSDVTVYTESLIKKISSNIDNLLKKFDKSGYEKTLEMFKEASTGVALLDKLKEELAELTAYGKKIGIDQKVLDNATDILNKNTDYLQDQLDKLAALFKKVETDNKIDDTDTAIDDLPDNPTEAQKKAVKDKLDNAAKDVALLAKDAESKANAAKKAAEKALKTGDKADLADAQAKLAEAEAALKNAADSKAKLDAVINKATGKGIDTHDAQQDADNAQKSLDSAETALKNAADIIDELKNTIDNEIDDTGKAIDDLPDNPTAEQKKEVKDKLDKTAESVDKLAEAAEKLAEDAKKAAEKARDSGDKKDLADAENKLEKAKDALKDAEDAKAKLDDLIAKAEDKGIDTTDAKKEADSAQDHLDKAQDNVNSTESIIDDVKAKNDLDGTDTDDKDLSKVKAQLDKAADSVSKQAESAEKLAKSAEKAAEKARESGDKADLDYAKKLLADAREALSNAADSKAKLDTLISKAGEKGVDIKDAQADAGEAQKHLDSAGKTLDNAGKIISSIQSDIDNKIDDTNTAIDDLPDNPTAEQKKEVKDKLDKTAESVDKLAEAAEKLAEDAKKAAEKARDSGDKKDLADAENKLEKAKDALKDAEDAKAKLDDLIAKAEDKGIDTTDAKKEADSAQDHLDKAQDNLDSTESIIDDVKAKNDLDGTDTDDKDLSKVKAQLDKAADSVSKQAESAEKLAKSAEKAAEKARESGDKADLSKAEAKLAEAKDALKKATESKTQLDELISKAGAKGVDTKDAQADADAAQQHLNGAGSALTNAGKIISDLQNKSDIDKDLDDTGKAIDDLDDKSTAKEKAEAKEKLDNTAKNVDKLAEDAQWLAEKAKEAAEIARNTGNKKDIADAQAKQDKAQDALKKAEEAKSKLDDLITKAKGKGVDTSDAEKESDSAQIHLDKAQEILDDSARIIDEAKAKNDLNDTDTDVGKLPDNPTPQDLAKVKAQLDKAAGSVLQQAENAKELAKTAQMEAERASDTGYKSDLVYARVKLAEATETLKRATDSKAKLDDLISKAGAKGVDTKDALKDAHLAQELLNDARDALTDAEQVLSDLMKDIDNTIDDTNTAIDDLPDHPTDEQKADVKERLDFTAKLVDNLADEAETLANAAKVAADKARKSGSKSDLENAQAKQADAKDALKKAEDAKAKLDKLISKAADKGVDTGDAAKDAGSAEKHIGNAHNTINATDKILSDLKDDNDSKDAIDHAEDDIKNLDDNATPEEKAKAKESLDAASDMVVALADSAKTLAAKAKVAAEKAQSGHDINDLKSAQALLKEAQSAFNEAGAAKARLDKLITQAKGKGVDTKDASADSDTAKTYLDDAQQNLTASENILKDMPTEMTDPALDDAGKAIDDATKNPSDENKAKAKDSLNQAATLVAKQAKEAEALAKNAKAAADKAKASGSPDDIRAAEEAIKTASESIAKAEKSKAHLDELIGKAKAAGIDAAQSETLSHDAENSLTNANNVLKEAAQTLDDLSNQEGDPALIAEVQTALDNLSDQIQNAQNKGVSANSKIDKLVGLTSPAEKDIQEAKAALAEFIKAIKAAESADPAVKAALDKAVKGGVGNKKLAELTEKETELLSLLNDQKKLSDSLNKQIQEIESNAVLDELNNALDGLDPKKPETVNAFNKALKKAIENNNELITELTEKAQKALDSALKLAQTDPTSDAYQQLLQDVKQQISNAEELYALAKNNTTDLQRVVEKAIGKGLDPAKNAEFKEYIANIKYFENEINKAGANIAKAKNAVPDEKLPDFDGDDISNLVDHLEDQIKAGDAAGINKTLLDVDSVIYTQLNDVNKALDKAGRAFEKAQKDPTTANVKAFDKAVLDAQSVINKAELNISKLHDSLVKAGTIAGVDADSLAHALKSAEKAGTAVDEAQKTLDGFSLNPIDMEGLHDKATDAKDAVDEMVKNPTPDNIDNALSKLNIFKSALGTSLTNAKALSDDALMAAKQAVKTPTAENILRAEKKLAKAVEAQEQLVEAKAMYDDVRTHISTSVKNKALQDALLKTFDGMDNQFDHTQKNVNEQNDESGKLIAIAKDNLLTEEDIVDAYNNAKLTLTDAEAKVREAVDKAAKAKESGDISKEQTTAIKNSVIGAQDSLNKAKDAIENAGNKGVPEYLLDQLNKYYNSLDNKLDYPKGVLQEIDSYSRMTLSLELLNNATDYYKKAEALLEKDPNAVIKDPSEFLSLISEANAYLAEGKERATKAKALGLDKESETYLNTAAHTANETQTKLMNDFHGKLGEKAFADLDAELTQLQESVYNAHSSLNKSTQSNHAVFEEQYKAAIRALNDTKLLIEDYTAKGVKPVKLSYYNYQVEQYSKEIENLSKAWNSVTELTNITNTVYSESKALSGIKNSSDKYDAIQKVGEDLGKAYQLVEQSIINGAPIDMIQSNLNKLTATANNLSAQDPIVAAQVLINNVVSESKNIENLLKAADTKVQKDLIYNSLYGQLQTANKVMFDAKQSGTISKTQLAELQQDYSNALNTLKMYDPYFSNGEQTQKPNTMIDPMTIQVTDDGYIHIEGRKLVDGAVYTLGGKDLPWYSAWLGNLSGKVDKVFGSGTVHTRTDGTKYVDIFVDKETAYNVKHSDNLSYLYGFQQELGKDPSELSGGFRVKDSSAPKDMEAFITDDHTIVVTGDGLKAGDSVTLYKVTTSGLLGTKNYEEVAKGHVALHNGKFVGVMTEYAKGHSWETVKNLGGDDNLAATRKGLGENQSGKSEVFGKIASPAEISSDIIGGNKTADILTKDVTAWVDTKKNLYLKSQKFEVGQLVKIHDFYDSKNVVGTGVVQMIGGQKIVKIEGVTTDKYPDLKWIYAEIAYEGGQWDYIQSDAFILGKNWLSVQGNANSNTQEPPKDNDANDGINFDDINIDPSAPVGKPVVKSFNIQDETDGQPEEQAKETDDIRDTQEESHEIRTENDEQSVNEAQSEVLAASDEINDDVDLSGLLNAGNTSAGETGDIDTTDGITGLPVLDELLTDSAESTINIDNIVPQAADTEHNVQPELFINNTADSSTETHQVSTLITEDDMGITHNI